MSEENVASIIASIGKLQTRVMSIFIALLLGAFTLGGWQTMLMFRLSSLEAWKAERQKPIDDYYKTQKDVESKLAVLTQRSDDAEKWRDRMEAKIDIVISRVNK